MNYNNQAIESMNKGIAVQSLVSKTIYEISDQGLLAEGLPVAADYITQEEKNGYWQEVTIIDSVEELEALSAEDKQRMLRDAYENAKFNEKHGR